MKRLLLLLTLMLISITTIAQTFPTQAIFNNGDDSKRINLVILPDGYQSSELNDFVTDATAFTNAMFSQSPFLEYKNYFNVYVILVPSQESGADHPATANDEPNPPFPPILILNMTHLVYTDFYILLHFLT